MDFVGMCYFVTSCLSHAALINLAVFLVFCLPWALTHHEKIGRTLTIVAECLLLVMIVANLEIFRIYRFHFNGIILNMLTGPGAGEIFNIGGVVYFKSALEERGRRLADNYRQASASASRLSCQREAVQPGNGLP